jgi:hypothetical protein
VGENVGFGAKELQKANQQQPKIHHHGINCLG